MPTASEAMAILRRALPGLVPARGSATGDVGLDDGPQYGDATGSLALADLRGARESELQNRLANDQFGATPDPDTGRAALLLKFLQGDKAADPYTGTAARARTQHVQDQLDDAATFDRPEITHVRNEQLADKEQLATAVPRVTGEYDLRHQALINQGAIDKQRIASDALVQAAGVKGAGGPRSTLPASIMGRVGEGSNMLASLERLRALKDKTWTGPAAARAQKFIQKVPLIEGSDKFAEFDAESAALNNTLIHAMTGAQSSKEERDRILAQAPQPTDQDNAWRRHADVTARVIRGLNIRMGLLAAGVSAADLDQLPVEEYAKMEEENARHAAATPAPTAPAAGFTIKR